MSTIDRVLGVPGDLAGALRDLPRIVDNLDRIAEATKSLGRIERTMTAISKSTQTLPNVERNIGEVAEATGQVGAIEERMANIEAAMPVLVNVQRQLVGLPETLARLEGQIGDLASVLERLHVTMEELHESMGPLSRLA